ncbi:DUF2057 domain-containing protein [Vibrio sp. SCSIO 43136]|uniref:YccT family protein n=1 Tax=Vibrio sp. SCSIO 43136 TaxID=2819101 RepID=UPI0020759487|nr:DUF2057 domain-containing protein [Vibrio sp. SCSIO 43136]USD64358.1 DUF2057 domain-containing protein [Vibrio sp. SCSIO 43136]
MRCTKVLALAAVSLFSFHTFAAELIPAKGVAILFANGSETESKYQPVAITDGTNQVVVEVNTMVGNGSKKEKFSSKPFILTFEAGQQDVNLAHPKIYSIIHAEQVFRTSPEWSLTSGGSNIAYTSDLLKGKEGLLPYSDIAPLVQNYNEQKGLAIATTVAVVAKPQPKLAVKPEVKPEASAVPKASEPLSELKKWYIAASDADRKAFRKWVIDQE